MQKYEKLDENKVQLLKNVQGSHNDANIEFWKMLFFGQVSVKIFQLRRKIYPQVPNLSVVVSGVSTASVLEATVNRQPGSRPWDS